MFILFAYSSTSECHYQHLVNHTAPHSYYAWLAISQTICINVTVPNTAILFDHIDSADVFVHWKINRKLLLVSSFSKVSNLGVIDFSDQIGDLEIRANRYGNVSLSILAFPRSCGPYRYVSDNPDSMIGLSSTISRAKFAANNEQFCFWVVPGKAFLMRVYPTTSSELFIVNECSHEGRCDSRELGGWIAGDSQHFFQIENRYSFYPSAFAVQVRSTDSSVKRRVSALLTEVNFTHYERVAVPNGQQLERARKSRGSVLLRVMCAVIVIALIVIGGFSRVCKPENVVHEDDTTSRQSLLANPLRSDGIPEIVGPAPVVQYEYPASLT
jgi:hypothetical protein